MISESRSYFAQVTEYFEKLAKAMELRDAERVQRYLARLSTFAYMFNVDDEDAFDEAVEWLDQQDVMDEPTEYDEWMDFDPDC